MHERLKKLKVCSESHYTVSKTDELSPYLSGSLLKTREDIAAGNLQYDPATTYMSLFVGDGDNIAFMRGGRRGWMNDRE